MNNTDIRRQLGWGLIPTNQNPDRSAVVSSGSDVPVVALNLLGENHEPIQKQ